MSVCFRIHKHTHTRNARRKRWRRHTHTQKNAHARDQATLADNTLSQIPKLNWTARARTAWLWGVMLKTKPPLSQSRDDDDVDELPRHSGAIASIRRKALRSYNRDEERESLTRCRCWSGEKRRANAVRNGACFNLNAIGYERTLIRTVPANITLIGKNYVQIFTLILWSTLHVENSHILYFTSLVVTSRMMSSHAVIIHDFFVGSVRLYCMCRNILVYIRHSYYLMCDHTFLWCLYVGVSVIYHNIKQVCRALHMIYVYLNNHVFI